MEENSAAVRTHVQVCLQMMMNLRRCVWLFLMCVLLCRLAVDGGWCEWSDWTPCSKTCGAEWVTQYRSCACPEPRSGGASCPDQQEEHAGLGVQIQRQPCPSITFCSGENTFIDLTQLIIRQMSLFYSSSFSSFM